MKKPTQKQELEIYRNFLISLHTARWTGNTIIFNKLMANLSAYSYSRTNSNAGNYKQEEKIMIRTLLNLNN